MSEKSLTLPHRTVLSRRAGRVRRAGLAAAGIVLAAGSLAACGSSETTDDTSEAAAAGAPADLPEGWTYVAGEADFDAEAGEQTLPATLTDGTGTEVTVKDTSKIIAAGDGIAAILGALGLGESIYAAPTGTVSPEAKAAPEHFEFSKETGVEGLLSVDGTLFIGDNTKRHGSVAEGFREAGVDALVIDDQSTLGEKITTVAAAVGLPEEGEKLAAEVADQLAEAEKTTSAASGDTLKIVEVTATGAGGQNSVAGTGTPGTEMIETIGATSVGAEAGLRGYSREMSNEGLLSGAPDVILLTVADLEKWGGEAGLWEAFPTLQQTPAAEEGRIYVMPDAQLKYPSPEIGVGAQALAAELAKD